MLIEDDLQMQSLISEYLERFDYIVESFADPKEALDRLGKSSDEFAVVVLDLMLPGMDGFDVCKIIKKETKLPVIISSARGDIGNKIYGFELGIDDYLAKPYDPRELILRIELVLKRSDNSKKIELSDFVIDEESREVVFDDFRVDMTRVEFDLLLYLVKNRDKTLSREQLIHASSLPPDTQNRTIDMHISNIRHKIGDDSKNPKYIKSIWGIGYKFIGN